jgi:thiol-disulfide isomerase/thioredoxin
MFYVMTSINKSNKVERFEEVDKVTVMLFYATWCPHCETYLQTGKFDTFDEACAEAGITHVEFKKFDYDKNKELGEQYDISGFPSIIATNGKEKKFVFYGNRENAADIVKFVKAVKSGKELTRTDY